jgi:hypothetical protein
MTIQNVSSVTKDKTDVPTQLTDPKQKSCPLPLIIGQLKTLFFYEDLDSMRSHLRKIVTEYDGHSCRQPKFSSSINKLQIRELSREKLR